MMIVHCRDLPGMSDDDVVEGRSYHRRYRAEAVGADPRTRASGRDAFRQVDRHAGGCERVADLGVPVAGDGVTAADHTELVEADISPGVVAVIMGAAPEL